MNLSNEISNISRILQRYDIHNPTLEAELIVSHVLSVSRKDILFSDLVITQQQSESIEKIVANRISGKPLQYLLGEVEFFDMNISVGEGVFIPRPETELMTEYAIKEIKKKQCSNPLILDICTGSGCIALALAKYIEGSFVVGTDISGVSLKYAKRNAKRNKIENIDFIRCDLFESIRIGCFDLIISNPPYIQSQEIKKLQLEVQKEPQIALDGGIDGLDFYRRIINNIRHSIKHNSILLLEIGFGQYKEVLGLLEQKYFSEVNIIKDYSGIDRILIARG